MIVWPHAAFSQRATWPPSASARSRSSPSADRGSHGRGWPRAKQDRGRGGCPRPPEPVEPQSPAIAPPAPRCVAWEAWAQARERALDLGDESCRHAGVASRRVELFVSEQRLNQPNVLAVLEQMGCEGMTQRMKRDRLAQPRRLRRLLEQPAELARSRRVTINATGKQPTLFRRNAGVAPGRAATSTIAATGRGSRPEASHYGPCGLSTARCG